MAQVRKGGVRLNGIWDVLGAKSCGYQVTELEAHGHMLPYVLQQTGTRALIQQQIHAEGQKLKLQRDPNAPPIISIRRVLWRARRMNAHSFFQARLEANELNRLDYLRQELRSLNCTASQELVPIKETIAGLEITVYAITVYRS